MQEVDYEPIPRWSCDDQYGSARQRLYPSKWAYRRQCLRLLQRPLRFFAVTIFAFTLTLFLNAVLVPLYTKPSEFVHPNDEAVFIAANIVSPALLEGPWTESLVALAKRFPSQQVHVSVYGGPSPSIKHLDDQLRAAGIPRTIISESQQPVDVSSLRKIVSPTGVPRTKRIDYLAEVRNMALKPLEVLPKRFNKVLFLNDVFFDPDEALRLLFGTGIPEITPEQIAAGTVPRTTYRAACAMDFSSPLKFYDTFATRDTAGYSMGVPLFPFAARIGLAQTYKDFWAGKDAVRVRSCWGGMVAFDARFFQSPPAEISATSPSDPAHADGLHETREAYIKWVESQVGIEAAKAWQPVRFRSMTDSLWEASECCLIHADIQKRLPITTNGEITDEDVGIYINPFIRVAYDQQTFDRLWIGRRFERLLSPISLLANRLASMPRKNARRTEVAGEFYRHRVWVENNGTHDGYYDWEDERAESGAWCATRQISVLVDGKVDEGAKNWERLSLPSES